MTDTIFFRLLDRVNRPARLSDAIAELREGEEAADAYSAEPASLRQVPGSPFAYWVSEMVRSKFVQMPPLEFPGREVRLGDHPSDDFRYLRLFWEVQTDPPNLDWRPYQKGGDYSPYYYDVHLIADWDAARQTYRGFYGRPGRASERPSNYQYFFRPGLTWPRRTTSGISVRVLPAGCIFADKGPAVFSTLTEPLVLLALMNSRVFSALVALHMGAAHTAARSYEVGVIQRIPVPELPEAEAERLAVHALHCVDIKRSFDSANETSHAFRLPAILQAEGVTLEERLERWQELVYDGERQLTEYQREIDDTAFQLYGIEGEDRRAIEESLSSVEGAAVSAEDSGAVEVEDTEEATTGFDSGALAADLLSYAVGCVFGRWDARIAKDSSLTPKLADPFAPLPVCSPGMLIGSDGLPAKRDSIASEEWMWARPDVITPPPEGSVENPTITDSEYPLAVDWDGILVDDPEHDDDILRRVREVLDLLWGEHTDAIEQEACELLSVKDLRTYFRNPRKFFDYHIKRYSKSRRKAPIYWLLQSPNRYYGFWLYYHRLDSDTLLKALTRYVEPKIRLEESRLEEYETQRRNAGTGGRVAKRAEETVEVQEALLTDLREFRDRLERAAKLYLRPDLNDGVVLNIAPLHELVPWKEAKSKWNELLSGKYEWSSIGKQLREKEIV